MERQTYTRLVGAFLGALLITVGFLAFTPQTGLAQDSSQSAPADRIGRYGFGGHWGRGGRMGGPMGAGALGPIMRDLTDAQREQVRGIHDRHTAEVRPLTERVRNARLAIDEAVFAGAGDYRALALDLGNAEAELAIAQAQIQTEVLAVLTAEQKQKITERRKEMAARRAGQN